MSLPYKVTNIDNFIDNLIFYDDTGYDFLFKTK